MRSTSELVIEILLEVLKNQNKLKDVLLRLKGGCKSLNFRSNG